MNEEKSHNPYIAATALLTIIVVIQFLVILMQFNKGRSGEKDYGNINKTIGSGFNIPTLYATPTIEPRSETYPLGEMYQITVSGASEDVEIIDFFIKEYEFTNQVVVNNVYKALLKEDKEILVLHVELTNNTNRGIEILAGDYVRLTIGDNDKFLAPDITSDPVEMRPKSTIETWLGFTINKTTDSLSIYLGKLDGEMKKIDLEK